MLQAEAQRFAALGDATRLQLIVHLSDAEPRPINRLTAATALSRQAVTKHLNVLEAAGLVRAQRAGRERLFTLQPEGLSAAQAYLTVVARQWDEALDRLRLHVEG